MQVAPLTDDEAERIQRLHAYGVLDSAAEKVFDDLTQLASDICDTPIALISLVDVNRQWFKARVGLDATETHRDLAFCAHAIHGRKVFEVPDASQDQRFADNPLVTQAPNIRFYAGAPLITPDGHAIGTLCTIDRIPKSLTDKQRRALQILAHEVISQLELRQKIQALEQANHNKSAFISRISHELRTPLNAIVGFSELLIDKSARFGLPEKVTQYLQHIAFSGQKLGELINSVLDLAKIEAGKMDVHNSSINLPALLDNIRGMLLGKASEKGVLFNLQQAPQLPQWITTDETKLSQILINLLNNAIKFTPRGKQVSLLCSQQAGELVFCVEDQGIGIPLARQARLFQPFEQGDSSISQRFGGTGLGLTIVKSLLELMHGSITLQSRPGQTRFEVRLPLHNAAAPQPQTPVTQAGLLRGRILVVEDNLINQEVLRAMLEDTELTLDICRTGEDGVDAFTRTVADLVLMDIHLPGIDGHEAARRILAINPGVPIIALSADILSQGRGQQSPLFREALPKPVKHADLLASLHRHLPASP